MEEEFIVKGAMATCQFGVAPSMLNNILDNMNVYFNGKLAVTSMTLGPAFPSPAVGTCNMVPNMPKPCVAMITKWDSVYSGMYINRIAHPLTKNSKGTCALGCPMCISFQTTGQIPIPSLPAMEMAKVEHQSDMNPMATNEEEPKDDITPIIKSIEFIDSDGCRVDEVPENGIVTVVAETEGTVPGDGFTFTINTSNGKTITIDTVVGNDYRAMAKNVNLK